MHAVVAMVCKELKSVCRNGNDHMTHYVTPLLLLYSCIDEGFALGKGHG